MLINQHGVWGMTFQELSQMVGLTTSSITHYFRFKEDLAAAVFEQTLERFEALVNDAGSQPTPEARVAQFYESQFQHFAGIVRGGPHRMAILSDIRSLEPEIRAPLQAHYLRIFLKVFGFFRPPVTDEDVALTAARAQIILEVSFWLPAWLGRYALDDFGRVQSQLLDILGRGLAPTHSSWCPCFLPGLDGSDSFGDGATRAGFLRAATRLINSNGYRGASVERIASEMKVTKGSFYHHVDGKDDLVFECFRQSYRRISRAKRMADDAGGDHWQRLTTAVSSLLDVQFAGEWPLLRTTALHAMPVELRADVVERSDRTALRFAGTITDGIKEGSIRSVDALIASQVIMAVLNGACDLSEWAQPLGKAAAVAMYGASLAIGVLDDPQSVT